jgi:threonylcarbamoyladenosine tRNA methylthiotransferase MtaB
MSREKMTVGIVTLGCKVNQYESEAIGELFSSRGYQVLHGGDVCDIYVINTCTVTAESDRKARQIIRRAIQKNPNAYVLVTGCLAQTSPDSLAEIAGVDYICGNAEKCAVVDAADDLVRRGQKNQKAECFVPSLDSASFEPMRICKFDRTRAYIKIEDGCESRCTYCIIPKARGGIRSKPMEEVLDEVRTLTAGGCREIVLTGIETASYGKDLGGVSLIDLLEEVDRIPNIGRVRLGSLDPSIMKQPFIDRLARLSSVTPHFHLSMQSGSDRILALMKRKYNTSMALESIERLRRAMPRVMLTTDMIVGFPTETDEDFEQTLEFAEKAQFLMIHVFPYSGRRGTPAAAMSGQVPMDVRRERAAILSQRQADIQKKLLTSQIEQCPMSEVLFETSKDGYFYGHTDNFLEVRVKTDQPLHATIAKVRLLHTDGNITDAELIDKE